ncbi:MAG TPA: hypothetical protein VE569_09740, partial [Acidimicrobiia bacterium]|nr:hypothetical protein [Acidimicrobiia bacterium]
VGLVVIVASCANDTTTPETTPETVPDTTSSTTSTSTTATTTTPTLPRLRTYHIGNSLTWDSLDFQPDATGYKVLARQADVIVEDGWHIKCGSSLSSIAAAPTDTCVDPKEPFGFYEDALSGFTWDAVTAQPYPGADSTLSTDIAFFQYLTDLTDGARLYVLAAWPPHTGYREAWTAPTSGDDPNTSLSAPYLDRLYQSLTGICPGIGVVPTGEVLYELAADIDLETLYRDELHLNEKGRFVAGVTLASVITGADPHNLHKPNNWYGDSAEFSSEFQSLVQETVARVITDNPRANASGVC